uniref:Angiotensin-converting enzyme n=2 Tax=Meloidogyne TaxID=189290 RepID=A0A915LVJ6_MELJA
MIIRLSLNRWHPSMMFALFLLMQCCEAPHSPNRPQHPAEAELEHQKIKLIKETEEKFKKLVEPTLESDGTNEQIKNRIEILEKEHFGEYVKTVEEFINIFKKFLKAQDGIKFPEMDITTNFVAPINPFLTETGPIENLTKLEAALEALKSNKSREQYNALFEHLKVFWLVEKENLDIPASSQHADNQHHSLDNLSLVPVEPSSLHKDMIQFGEHDGNVNYNPFAEPTGINRSLVPHLNPLQMVVHPQGQTQHKTNLDQLTNELGPQNAIGHQNKETLYKEFLNLRRTVNKLLRQIMSEFIIGFPHNSFECMAREFDLVGEIFYAEALDLQASQIAKELYKLKPLYMKAISHTNDLAGFGIEGYWEQNLRKLKSDGFVKAVETPRTKEHGIIEEFIHFNYKGYDRDFNSLIEIREKLKKNAEGNENGDFNMAFLELWDSVPNKVPMFELEDFKFEMMEIEYSLMETHYPLLKASQEVYKTLNDMLESFFAFTELDAKLLKMNKEELAEFKTKQKTHSNFDKLQKRYDQLKLRIKTWCLAEFWLKEAIKDVGKFLPNYGTNYLAQFFTDLTNETEEKLNLPTNWLKHEKGQVNLHGHKNLYGLSVLIRINAGKVLLAYTRIKKLFSAFDFNVGKYYNDSAMMLAQSYGKEFGLKSEDFQKHVFENVGERLKKIEKDMPSTSGN